MLAEMSYKAHLLPHPEPCPNAHGVYRALVTSREIIARLKADGWILGNVRGSHHQYKHPERSGRVTVPHPKKDFPKGTLRSIFQQAGWPWPP